VIMPTVADRLSIVAQFGSHETAPGGMLITESTTAVLLLRGELVVHRETTL